MMEILERTIDTRTPPAGASSSGRSEPSFVEALVDPVNVFGDPVDVVGHRRFTDEEKRTILLSWARDELVAEQVARKLTPELQPKSRIDAVVEALAQFDAPAAGEYLSAVAAIRACHLRGSRRRRQH